MIILYTLDQSNVCTMDLLLRLLYPCSMGKDTVFFKHYEVCVYIHCCFCQVIVHFIQTCDIDIDKEASNIKQPEPYLIITGVLDAENCQIFVCSEQQPLFELKSVKDGVID